MITIWIASFLAAGSIAQAEEETLDSEAIVYEDDPLILLDEEEEE